MAASCEAISKHVVSKHIANLGILSAATPNALEKQHSQIKSSKLIFQLCGVGIVVSTLERQYSLTPSS